MTKRAGQTHSPGFKAKLALAASKGKQPLAGLAKLRSAVRTRGHFPTDGEARCATGSSTVPNALTLLQLVVHGTEREWRMPPREWASAKAQLAVLFGQRFTRALA